MGIIVCSIFFLILTLSLWMIGSMLKKQGKEFEATKKQGRAEVVGYEHNSGSNSTHYNLSVKLLDIDDDTISNCLTGAVDAKTIKKGEVIDVVYGDTRILGIPTREIYLIGGAIPDKQKSGKIFGFVALGCAIIGVVIDIILLLA